MEKMDDREFKKTLNVLGALIVAGLLFSLTMVYVVTKVIKFAWGDCS